MCGEGRDAGTCWGCTTAPGVPEHAAAIALCLVFVMSGCYQSSPSLCGHVCCARLCDFTHARMTQVIVG